MKYWMCNLLLLYLFQYLRGRRIEVIEDIPLPIEILAQIFTHLDFPSVRAVRLTCKAFYSVTKTRQFWYNHINELIKVRHITSPEEILDDYTVEELEKWTLRRARAVDVFFNGQYPRFRKRTLDLRAEGLTGLNPWNIKLLPGGRWLLASHSSAILYFLDLDCPDPNPRLLFDPKERDDGKHGPENGRFSIWIDRGSPRLSFRLAFYVKSKNTLRTYTSQIDLVGHGIDATLAISNIAMLRHFDLDLWSPGMVLNNRYLFQVWGDKSPTNGRIRVYDYRRALGCPDYSMYHDSGHNVYPAGMELICDNMFAIDCLLSRSLLIFEVEPSASVKLLHRIDMMNYFSWSTPRWTPGATFTTMINHGSREIQGLVIPHDPSHPPTIITLGSMRERRYTLGTWVVVTHLNPYMIFGRDWDSGPPDQVPPYLPYLFQEEFMRDLLTFDEDTGRFLGYQLQWQLVICDMI